METLIKSLSGYENLQKLVSTSSQNKNEPLEFYFKNYHQNLSNTEINVFCNNLLKEDQTRVLQISHQKDFINLEALADFTDKSRCLRLLDVSYCDFANLKPLFLALNAKSAAEDPRHSHSYDYDDHHDSHQESKNLQFLNISGTDIPFEDACLLGEQLKTNTTLLALKLNNCKLKIDSIIRILEGLYENKTLESLDLSRQSRLVENYNLSIHIQKYFSNNSQTLTRLTLRHLELSDQSVHNIVLGLLNGENNLQHLDLSNNRLSRDCANSLVKLLNGSKKIKTLNLSKNRLENEGTIKICKALAREESSLKTLIIKSVEASEEAWVNAEKLLSYQSSSPLSEFYIWGNNFQGQKGAWALKNMIDGKRFRSGISIDVQPYIVDDFVWMAESGDSALVAENRFHSVVDGEDDDY